MSAAQDTIASLRDDGTEIIAIGVLMLSLAVSAVLLRFLAKARIEKEFGLDDVLIGIALLSYSTAESLVLRGVDIGRQAVDENSPQYSLFLKLSWGYSFLYWSNITFPTLSILFLYRRLFSIHRFFSHASLILVALTVAWWLSGTLCDILSWRPTESYWDLSISGQYYINYNIFWMTSMVAELLIETLVLALPIREIIKLQLSTRKKALIVTMFCMGGFVLITGIVRIYYAWNKSDMTPGTIWLSVHSSVAIISACLPTYRPLLARLVGRDMMNTRRGSYDDTCLTSLRKNSVQHPTATRRCTPSATLNLAASREEDTRSSSDAALITYPKAAKTSQASSNTVDDDPEKDAELEELDISHNGLTKKISVPSPTSTDGAWGPLMDSQITGGGDRKWPWDDGGPATKRAHLEYQRSRS